MICAVIVLFLIGIIHSLIVKNFTWFQRIGSIIVGIGIILLSRPVIIKQSLLIEIKMSDSPYTSNDPRHYEYTGEQVPKAVNEDVKNRKAVYVQGPIITLVGTFIWGYGDLLNCLIY